MANRWNAALPCARGASRRGSALILAVLLVMVLTVLGLALLTVADVEREIALNDQRAALSREIARSALSYGRVTLRNNADTFGANDMPWDDDLRGEPQGAGMGVVQPVWKCVDNAKPANEECRDCLRTAADIGVLDPACIGKIKGMPLYDYRFPTGAGRYLIEQPVMNEQNSLQAPATPGGVDDGTAIKGYFTLWIRNNPNDPSGLPFQSGTPAPAQQTDKRVVLVAEAWVKKHEDQMKDYWANPNISRGTAKNPIVARTVYAEVILQGDMEHSAYITGGGGAGIDQHNTNTIYAK